MTNPMRFTLCAAVAAIIFFQPREVWAAEGRQIPGHVPSATRKLVSSRDLPADRQLSLAIGIPLRNAEALTNLLADIYNPASPRFRKFLTVDQFVEQFGPTDSDYKTVIGFAAANHLTVTTQHANRMLLDVSGRVADIENAFHVKMRVYRHPREPRDFFAPDREPSVSADAPILHISGLNNYFLPRPANLKIQPLKHPAGPVPAVGSGPSGTYMGPDFRAAYAPGVRLTGAGQIVALLQFDGYDASDIASYVSQAGIPAVPLLNVLVDGYSGTAGQNSDEVSLDIEMVTSMAPGLSKIMVYEGGQSTPANDILNQMATDNLAKQISASWTYSVDATTIQIYQQFALQGQSYFNASGDSDAYLGAVDTPCDNSYITSVGGTTLTTAGPAGAWVSEKVWNWGSGQGSGGGVSQTYSLPVWQQGVDMSANHGSTTMRNLPDVAMAGDNVFVVYGGGQEGDFGGTSCSSPLWAAFMSLINEEAANNGKPAMGFLNPAVYALGAGSQYAASFHDIITGNNTNGSSGDLFQAVPGYDLCTGWGTPSGQILIDALVNPDSLLVIPSVGFAAVGPYGGPFSTQSSSFVLTNAGTNTLTWSLGNTSVWFSATPPGGSLAAGSSGGFTIGLAAPVNTLVPGAYSATLWITNVTTGVVHPLTFDLVITDPLVISPAVGFSAGGPAGGPFNLSSETLSLTNAGRSPLIWTLTNTVTWLDVSTNGGAVTPGGPAATLTVSLNSQATSLPNGAYVGTVIFIDQSVGSRQDLQFTLVIGHVPVANNGFEEGDFDGWTQSGNTTYTTVTNASGYVHSGVYGAELGPAINLGYLSQILPTSPGQTYKISFWLANPAIDDPYTGTTNEFVVLWNGLSLLDVMNMPASGWTNVQIVVRADEPNTTLQFGFRNDPSFFGLDDISVEPTPPVTNPPAITVQPADQNAGTGWNVRFSVGATGSLPLYYQWQFNSNSIPGATNATLTLNSVALNQSGSYSVVIANPYGSVTSSNANLLVTQVLVQNGGFETGGFSGWNQSGNVQYTLVTGTPPYVHSGAYGGQLGPDGSLGYLSQTLSTTPGATYTISLWLNCVDGETPNQFLIWWNGTIVFNHANLGAIGWTNIVLTEVATGPSTVFQLGFENDNSYFGLDDVIVTPAAGTQGPPKITLQPAGAATQNGGTVSFNVGVTGSNPLAYQWMLNSTPVAGATNSILTLSNVATNQAGNYSVVVTNTLGTATSSNAVLNVFYVPPGAILVTFDELAFNNGGFNVPNGYQTMNWSNFLYLNGPEYPYNPSGWEAGMISASNVAFNGNATPASITSLLPFDFDSAYLTGGWNDGLHVEVQGFVGGNLTYDHTYTVNATTPTFIKFNYYGVSEVQFISSGGTLHPGYAAGGSHLVIDNLLIYTNAPIGPPRFATQPASQVVTAGSGASFSVNVVGIPPVSYQWMFNSHPVSGATASTFTMNSVALGQSGNYSVIAANSYGATTSSIAVLSVAPLSVAQNGGFETGNFLGWSLSGNTDMIITNSPLYAHFGQYGAQLGPYGPLGHLTQTLPTIAGRSYLISYWLDSPDGVLPNEFRVAWNGNILWDQTNLPAIGWTNMQFIATAISANSVLDFGVLDIKSYLGLDNIAVIPIYAPAIQNVTRSGGAMQLVWSTIPGQTYQLQYTTSLGQSAWKNLGDPTIANSITMATSDSAPADQQRFYRIVVVP